MSRLIQPEIGLALLAAGHQSSSFQQSGGLVGRQVLAHARVVEQARHPRRLVEALVVAGTCRSGRERMSIEPAQPAADELRVPVQRLDHLVAHCSPPSGSTKHGGVAQVGAHPHLGDGHRDAGQRRIVDLLLAEDLDQGVAHQFAGAQLALRRALRRARGRVEVGRFMEVSLETWRTDRTPAQEGRASRAVDGGSPANASPQKPRCEPGLLCKPDFRQIRREQPAPAGGYAAGARRCCRSLSASSPRLPAPERR